MLVLIADGGLGRSQLNTQMIEIANRAVKPVADITYRLTFGKLTKKRCHQMRPACVAFLVLIGLMEGDKFRKRKRSNLEMI